MRIEEGLGEVAVRNFMGTVQDDSVKEIDETNTIDLKKVDFQDITRKNDSDSLSLVDFLILTTK